MHADIYLQLENVLLPITRNASTVLLPILTCTLMIVFLPVITSALTVSLSITKSTESEDEILNNSHKTPINKITTIKLITKALNLVIIILTKSIEHKFHC